MSTASPGRAQMKNPLVNRAGPCPDSIKCSRGRGKRGCCCLKGSFKLAARKDSMAAAPARNLRMSSHLTRSISEDAGRKRLLQHKRTLFGEPMCQSRVDQNIHRAVAIVCDLFEPFV